MTVPDNNVAISCLVSCQDYSNLSNCRCIEAPPIFTHWHAVRIDEDIENRRGGILEGIFEAANEMIAIMQHVLEWPDDVSSCSRIDLLSACCLHFRIGDEVDLQKLGLFLRQREEATDGVVYLALDFEGRHVAVLCDLRVCSEAGHLEAAVVLTNVVEQVPTLWCVSGVE